MNLQNMYRHVSSDYYLFCKWKASLICTNNMSSGHVNELSSNDTNRSNDTNKV